MKKLGLGTIMFLLIFLCASFLNLNTAWALSCKMGKPACSPSMKVTDASEELAYLKDKKIPLHKEAVEEVKQFYSALVFYRRY
ncbi:hypothetical protein [Marinicrinis sediminis]|uniref:Uncharacterized protein n=1 Tax=Marinicrinis sediminis TaxID=1652465 RepID=A0ABW5R6P3_9BACL